MTLLDLPSSPAWASVDWAWLAGLLEGEGSFGVATSRKSDGSVYEYPRIHLQMCDEDVVRHAAQMMQAYDVYRYIPSDPNHSDRYKTKVQGAKAIRVMHLIRPYMGDRRGAKIDELLNRGSWGRIA